MVHDRRPRGNDEVFRKPLGQRFFQKLADFWLVFEKLPEGVSLGRVLQEVGAVEGALADRVFEVRAKPHQKAGLHGGRPDKRLFFGPGPGGAFLKELGGSGGAGGEVAYFVKGHAVVVFGADAADADASLVMIGRLVVRVLVRSPLDSNLVQSCE